MKWVIIKGVRYPSSVISAFAAYNMDNPFLKVRIRNKYHIVPFDDVNKMANQMVYLMGNYPGFVQIGRWWISKKAVMSLVPKGQAVDGSGWVISFTLSFGLEGGTQIGFDKEDEYLSEIDRLNELFKWIDKNGSFDEAGGLDLVRHGYEWIRRMRKFENKADRHTFQKVFGNKRGNELWDCFLEVGRSIFILEDSYFLINDRNVFSLCLAECSDYDLYELVHNIDTDSDQGK
jgi:hypothetical protein